jgi:16S rRNA (guanine527-N7)-methyltransferase
LRPADERALLEILEAGRRHGYLGPEPVRRHLEHSLALAKLVGAPPTRFVDLGSGAGVPGLVLATLWDDAEAVLVDANRRRCASLDDATGRLGMTGRVSVRCERAEVLARQPGLRGSFGLVVARAFGKPAVTAECAVGFLEPAGRLVVSEPPEASAHEPPRWPTSGLARLGLGPARAVRAEGVGAVVIPALGQPDERWPRAVGRPAKSPLW